MHEVVATPTVHGPLLPAPRRAPGGPAPAPAPAAAAPLLRRRTRRSDRRPTVVVVALLLGAALVASVALAAHLWLAQDAWRGQAEEAGVRSARLAATSEELQHRVDGLRADLDAADARVEQLAAEKARATDLSEARTR